MSTPPVKCLKCNKWSVIGEEHCVYHGGRIPKTIAEADEAVARARERLSVTGAQFYSSPGNPVLTSEPKEDRLREVREKLQHEINVHVFFREMHPEDKYYQGKIEGCLMALNLLDSLWSKSSCCL